MVANRGKGDKNEHNRFNEKLHKCRYCKVKYLSKRALCNHERLEHKEIYKKPERIKHCCSKCDLKCDSAHNLKRHFEIVHEGKKPHMCSICGKTFGFKSSLRDHMAVHAETKEIQHKSPGVSLLCVGRRKICYERF